MWRLNNEDRGASMVFIAICLVFLIGFAGLAVDVGALYAERTELQKGAEAAVLAIAEDCGHGTKPCDVPTASATADDYIDANATDLAGAVDSLDLNLAAQEVTVVDRTERADGGAVFLPFFAQVVGFEGTTVRAQASAAWGAPGALATLPLIISECEYQKYPESGWPAVSNFVPEYGNPWPGPPLTFFFHGSSEECHLSPSGQELPGGFGWLDTGGSDCVAETTIGSWIYDDPGASPSNGCTASYLEGLRGTIVPLPWFEEMTGTGSGGQYLIAGYSPFFVTGIYFAGQGRAESLYSGAYPCGGSDRCVEGYFVSGYTWPDGDPDPDAEYRGILIVKLTG